MTFCDDVYPEFEPEPEPEPEPESESQDSEPDPFEDLEPSEDDERIIRAYKEASTKTPSIVGESETERVLAMSLSLEEFQVFLERLGAPPYDPEAVEKNCEGCEDCEQFQHTGHFKLVSSEECECRDHHGETRN